MESEAYQSSGLSKDKGPEPCVQEEADRQGHQVQVQQTRNGPESPSSVLKGSADRCIWGLAQRLYLTCAMPILKARMIATVY